MDQMLTLTSNTSSWYYFKIPFAWFKTLYRMVCNIGFLVWLIGLDETNQILTWYLQEGVWPIGLVKMYYLASENSCQNWSIWSRPMSPTNRPILQIILYQTSQSDPFLLVSCQNLVWPDKLIFDVIPTRNITSEGQHQLHLVWDINIGLLVWLIGLDQMDQFWHEFSLAR